MFILSVFTILFVSVKAQQSPCPEYFNYLPDSELDTWYGEIHAYFDDDLIDGVFVTLVFDRNSIQIGVTFISLSSTSCCNCIVAVHLRAAGAQKK